MYDHLYDRSGCFAYTPPSKSRAGAARAKYDHVTAAKRRKLTEPSIYCYITYITLIMRLAGSEEIGVTQGIIAVVEASDFSQIKELLASR